MRPGSTICAAGALALALVTAPDVARLRLQPRAASASTVVEVSLAELASRATAVIAGTPLESRSVWESAGGARGERIVTYTRVHVDRVVDGRAPGELWVRTLGGQVDHIGQRVEGEAVLVAGQPALLFLAARADGTHSVVGMAQGHYPLETLPDASLRLAAPGALGRVLGAAGQTGDAHRPARLLLPGRKLDEIASLIAAERRSHGR
jgi:hypothetical protein